MNIDPEKEMITDGKIEKIFLENPLKDIYLTVSYGGRKNNFQMELGIPGLTH